jgi:prepilin-type processing-associated H-X9-DG protein
MNSKCQGDERAIADPAGTIMLFECDTNGKPDYIRHNGTINLAFADGHCKVYTKGSIKAGLWTPQAGD